MKKREERQLAAVMFTDIVGYTALMQDNEAVAASVRARHREVFKHHKNLYKVEIIQF
jgi:class 3 adenylate cyclase